jgi:hypothetical protein
VELATHALDVRDLAADEVGLEALVRLVVKVSQDERDSQIRKLPAGNWTMHVPVKSNVAARPDAR